MLNNVYAYDFPILHHFQNAINLANQEKVAISINVLDIEILVEPQSQIHDILCFWEEQLEKTKKK